MHKILYTHPPLELWEVWQGLPAEPEPAKTRDGAPTLKIEKPDMYVWLFPEAAKAYRENQDVVLMVLGTRTSKKIEFIVKLPSQADAIGHARELNNDILRKLKSKKGE